MEWTLVGFEVNGAHILGNLEATFSNNSLSTSCGIV